MSTRWSTSALLLAVLLASRRNRTHHSQAVEKKEKTESPDDKRQQMMFEWIRAEQDLANDRIANYPEADQKIIAAMATVIAAIIGISVAKIANVSDDAMPYVLFVASFLMSLAVNQNSLYSSLTLIYIERKIKLAQQMGALLGCSPDLAHTEKGLFHFSSMWSYKYSVLPHFLFKMAIGSLLCAAGYFHPKGNHSTLNFRMAFWISLTFALLSASVVLSHVVAGAIFEYKFNFKKLSKQS